MRIFILTLAVFGFSIAATAQNKGCPKEEYRLFDFWIGEWDVFAAGKKVGENSIQPILDGCVLQENWQGAQGSKGSSFNYYNPKTQKWHQFWVWRNGTTLPLLTGERKGNQMTLSGVEEQKDGKKLHHRITWTKNDDGTVRQYWENSSDGKSWKPAFDGIYKKKKGA